MANSQVLQMPIVEAFGAQPPATALDRVTAAVGES